MEHATLLLVAICCALDFDFANEEIIIALSENAGDIQGIENLDPNDHTRMNIEIDGFISDAI